MGRISSLTRHSQLEVKQHRTIYRGEEMHQEGRIASRSEEQTWKSLKCLIDIVLCSTLSQGDV